ncbi:membrane protein [Achlya hypogyna]|uniref:Membrane protein n=1 Tax=Achlya hypogyna TaxID=1202772 RepID=A0A1V9YMH7_ACHHY|nr:membrane protein [Achlya hypogyna]
MQQGILCALGAFTAWGFFPIYWKQLPDVPNIQVAVHRVFWSGLILIAMLFGTCQWRAFRAVAFTKRNVAIYGIAVVLLTGNFFIYVLATNSGRIIELSLGYFINPMVNAALGRVFLKEHLTKWQWVALGIALVGVLIPTIAYGKFPYLAITLAVTSGLYNLAKKMAPLDSFHGLTLETSLMLVPAAIFLLVVNGSGTGAFGHSDTKTDLLLVGTGAITILPLILFAKAAPAIPLTLMGILQYICPTIQFFIGIFMYDEPFTTTQLIGFIVIWIALIVFTTDSVVSYRRQTKANPDTEQPITPTSEYKLSDESAV